MVEARDDPAAFGPIFDAHVNAIYRFCLLRLWNHEQAEDAASQTFLKALASLDSYRGGSVPAWLFAIARTTVIDIQRRLQVEKTAVRRGRTEEAVESPETALIAAEDTRWLQAALKQLTDAQRQVVELRIAGLSGVEIAAATGRSPGSVRALQFRAMSELRRLHEAGESEGEAANA